MISYLYQISIPKSFIKLENEDFISSSINSKLIEASKGVCIFILKQGNSI